MVEVVEEEVESLWLHEQDGIVAKKDVFHVSK